MDEVTRRLLVQIDERLAEAVQAYWTDDSPLPGINAARELIEVALRDDA